MYQNQYRQQAPQQVAQHDPRYQSAQPMQRQPMPNPRQVAPMQQNPNPAPVYPNNRPNINSAPTQQEHDNKGKIERPEWFLQLNTFGGKHAFQVETSQTRGGWLTVSIESAERENPKDPDNKRYLWAQKRVLQMTKSELPVFTAVMLGLLPSARFDNHEGKWLDIINQGANFFIKSGGGTQPLHIAPMPTVEAYMMGTLALGQYCRNFHGLSTEAGLEIIKALAAQLANCGGYKQAQQR